MISVGTDLVEIPRFMNKGKKIYPKIFSQKEIEYINSLNPNAAVQSAAARFAAKEAFGKAIKTGIFKFPLTEVEILKDQNGAPYIRLSGKAEELAKGYTFSVSLTHTVNYAAATVVAVKE